MPQRGKEAWGKRLWEAGEEPGAAGSEVGGAGQLWRDQGPVKMEVC